MLILISLGLLYMPRERGSIVSPAIRQYRSRFLWGVLAFSSFALPSVQSSFHNPPPNFNRLKKLQLFNLFNQVHANGDVSESGHTVLYLNSFVSQCFTISDMQTWEKKNVLFFFHRIFFLLPFLFCFLRWELQSP